MTRMDNNKRDAAGALNLQSLKEVFPNSDPLADQIDYFVKSVINGAKPVTTERMSARPLILHY